jgi:phospholipid transport system substrate-binding protein
MKPFHRLLIGGAVALIGLGWAGSRAAAQSAAPKTIPAEAAIPVAPDVLVSAVSSEVLAILKRDFDAGNPSRVDELVEAKILPLFDFPQMTRIAMALHWRAASPAQKTELVAQFRKLLVRTYTAALASYRDEKVQYKPLRASAADTDVTVRSVVVRSGVEPLAIDYDMEKTAEGWKVYDVKVAGVSLIINYRASFAAEVRDHGIDGLIKQISEKNRQDLR